MIRLASFSIRSKIAITILVSILMIVVLSGWMVLRVNEVAQPAVVAQMEVLVRERAIDLSRFGSAIERTMKATLDQYAAAIPRVIADPSLKRVIGRLKAAFKTELARDNAVRDIRLVTLSGSLLVTEPTLDRGADTAAAYFRELKRLQPDPNTTFVSSLEITPQAALYFVRTILDDDNQPLAYLVFTVDPDSAVGDNLFRQLQTRQFSATTITMYWIDALADQPVQSPIFESLLSVGAARTLTATLAKDLLARPTLQTSPLTGANTLIYVRPVPALGKWLVAESRLVDAGTTTITGTVLSQLLTLGGGFVLALLSIWLLLERSTVRPLLRLARYATAVRQGRQTEAVLAADLPTRQQDEIGTVASAMTETIDRLESNIGQLEGNLGTAMRDIGVTRQLSQIIANVRDLDTLLNRVITLVQKSFPEIYHAQVYLPDVAGEYVNLQASTGDLGKRLLERGLRWPFGGTGTIGVVTATGQAVVALHTDPIFTLIELLPETASQLALPLRNGLAVIGVLDLHSKRATAFSDVEMRIFQVLADQLGIALSNAQLIRETARSVQEVEILNQQMIGTAWRDYNRQRKQTTAAVDEAWTPLQYQAVQLKTLVEQRDDDYVKLAIPILLRGVPLGAVEWAVPVAHYTEDMQLLASELAARLALTVDNARLFEQSQRATERERLINAISTQLTQQTDVPSILKIALKELGTALHIPQATIRVNKSAKP